MRIAEIVSHLGPGKWPRHSWSMFTLWVGGVLAMFWGQLAADLFGMGLLLIGGIFLVKVCWQQQSTAKWKKAERDARKKVQRGASLVLLVGGLVFAGIQTALHQTPASLGPKYSSSQILQVSNHPEHHRATLRLANAGVMRVCGVATRTGVDLVIPSSTPASVQRPRSGDELPTGQRGCVEIFVRTDENGKPVETREFIAYSQDKPPVRFDQFANRMHMVEMGSRRFQIALNWIDDKSNTIPGVHHLIEYEFGITEQ